MAVNRFWQGLFGQGLVKTQEDFGTRSLPAPAHPEVLDKLALDFIESGWNVKALLKQIVMTAAYRQDWAERDPALLERDPENVLLARGPRHEMSAEQIRDNASLASSGLLVLKQGGPSVKPYQPEGLWKDGRNSSLQARHGRGALSPQSLHVYQADHAAALTADL